MNRRERAARATEIDEIVERGHYEVEGAEVAVGAEVAAAVSGTHRHLPDDPALGDRPEATGAGKIEVTGESVLAAAHRLAQAAPDELVIVNGGHGRTPGGDYRKGGQSVEEHLARASALAACLRAVPEFYEQHQGLADPRYTDDMICSPGVPVVRGEDDGPLLARPYRATFVTTAPPNAGQLVQRGWKGDLAPLIEERLRRVLAAAAAHGHRRVVFGTWGGGLLHNDADTVAAAFAGLLQGEFASAFDQVVFAVTDVVPSAPTRRVYERHLDPVG